MTDRCREERGAALVIVLLFMVVTLILITAVLAVTGNEARIAGLHRDGIAALELAHAGLEEGIQRVNNHPSSYSGRWGEGGLPAMDPCPENQQPYRFVNSLGLPDSQATPGVGSALRIGVCGDVPSSEFREIRADAYVGKAVRRLSAIPQITAKNVPPEITRAGLIGGQGSSSSAGDTYSPVQVVYQPGKFPPPPARTFAGWRNGQGQGGGKPPAWTYANDPKPDPNWYPGTRLTIATNDPALDPDTGTSIVTELTNAGTCSFPPPPFIPYGDPPDSRAVRADRPNGPPDRGVPDAGWKLYGCTNDADADTNGDEVADGASFTYKYVRNGWMQYVNWGAPNQRIDYLPEGTPGAPFAGNPDFRPLYAKTILFNPWFQAYLKPTTGSPKANFNPANGDGAVPPFPTDAFLTEKCDQAFGAGTYVVESQSLCGKGPNPPKNLTINPNDYDLGSDAGVTSKCPRQGGRSRFSYFQANPGDQYKFAGGWSPGGYGFLVFQGDAEFGGGFNYTGTIIVKGNLNIGAGNVTIKGGLLVSGTVTLTGNLTIDNSDCVGSTSFSDNPIIPVGAMWER